MGIIEQGRFLEFLTFVLLFIIVIIYVVLAKKRDRSEDSKTGCP